MPKIDFLEKLKTQKFNQLDKYIFSLKTDISGNKTENDLHKKYQDKFDEFRIVWYDSEENKKVIITLTAEKLIDIIEKSQKIVMEGQGNILKHKKTNLIISIEEMEE